MKPRGCGSIYRRGRVWWLKYYDRTGRARHESSRSVLKSDAEKLLRERLGEVAMGKRPHDRACTFEDLARLIAEDYAANSRRGMARLALGLQRLAEDFAGWRAANIDYAALQGYRVRRAAAGIAPATIRWELGALRRAFNLAARAGLAECPIFPSIAVSNARQGFFERNEWDAIRQHLKPEFQDVGDFAYLTGWRIMEVLLLKWHQVTSGRLRLEPGTTGVGRNFPFADHPELAAVITRRAAKRDELQKSEMRIIPSVFFFHISDRFHRAGDPLVRAGSRPSSAFRMAWQKAAKAAGLVGRIPHDFRRTATRNMERAGLPGSVAKAFGGWKSDSMYNRYAIASDSDLRDGVRRLASVESSAQQTQAEKS